MEVVILLKVQFGKICLPKKIEDVNVIMPNVMKGINQSKPLVKHISIFHANAEVSLMVEIIIKKKRNNDKCQCECKNLKKHRVCEEDYNRNPSVCASECDKDCNISESLRDYAYMESLVDDPVVTFSLL